MEHISTEIFGNISYNINMKTTSWTIGCSSFLSHLLRQVIGSRDTIKARQEYCKVFDYVVSMGVGRNIYFTGSKAEGLDLPGSDDDYMFDFNDYFGIKISQSFPLGECVGRRSVFMMITKNVRPGFTMLRSESLIHNKELAEALTIVDNKPYLSCNAIVRNTESKLSHGCSSASLTASLQGPSVETRDKYEDITKPGQDNVVSIRCPFWPSTATEWINRPRHFGWPKQTDVEVITNFGCHLVPVGHPLSNQSHLEWRISFSVAERILVWSFNEVQMQCYAVMKLLFKEFIKRKCKQENYF